MGIGESKHYRAVANSITTTVQDIDVLSLGRDCKITRMIGDFTITHANPTDQIVNTEFVLHIRPNGTKVVTDPSATARNLNDLPEEELIRKFCPVKVMSTNTPTSENGPVAEWRVNFDINTSRNLSGNDDVCLSIVNDNNSASEIMGNIHFFTKE